MEAPRTQLDDSDYSLLPEDMISSYLTQNTLSFVGGSPWWPQATLEGESARYTSVGR